MYTKKRAFSLFMTFIMLFAIVGIMPKMEVGAIYQSEVITKLNSLMNQYVGTTWNDNYYGIQCKGFANLIFYKLFNVVHIGAYENTNKYYIPSPSGAIEVGRLNFSDMSQDNSKNLLQKGYPGDFIQVRRRGKSYGHSMILVNVDANGITVFDCNSDGKNGVKSYYVSYNDFYSKNSAMSLYHANNYIIDNPPVITNSYISQINFESFRVACDVYDNVGVDRVKMATWTTADQSDVIWRDAYFNGVSSWFIDIPRSDYREQPAIYITHIYAYDAQNNYAINEIIYQPDTEFPKITNKYISEMKSDSFRVVCDACDNVGIDHVRIATWTASDQSDLIWRDAYFDGVASWFIDIPTKDYRENSEVYISHIYVYDADGNATAEEIIYYPDYSGPEFTDVYLSEISDTSFRVVARVKDAKGVDSVKIATWTTPDQSDLIWREAANNGYGDYFVDIPVSEHSRNPDVFISHIYAYNSWNISSTKEILYKVNVKGDINSDGEFNVADVVLLQKWLVKKGSLTNWQAADMNSDGHVNVFDMIILKRRILKG